MSCHFIGYPERSKGYRFYCPDRHTKFIETRHAVFLEDEMIRGSTVPQEISLDEKRVCAPTPMIQEPFFSIPAVVATPVGGTPSAAVTEPEAPAAAVAPEVPTTAHEETEQPPEAESSASEPAQEPLRRSQRNKKSAIPADYEVYISEDADTEGDPTSFEEAIRSHYSSKWQAAWRMK